jgi:hypothetical protein
MAENWSTSSEIRGHIPPERPVTLLRNGRSRSSGISGQIGPKYSPNAVDGGKKIHAQKTIYKNFARRIRANKTSTFKPSELNGNQVAADILFHRTLAGAHVGDVFMSLIHTAELNEVSAYEYLIAVLRNAAASASRWARDGYLSANSVHRWKASVKHRYRKHSIYPDDRRGQLPCLCRKRRNDGSRIM